MQSTHRGQQFPALAAHNLNVSRAVESFIFPTALFCLLQNRGDSYTHILCNYQTTPSISSAENELCHFRIIWFKFQKKRPNQAPSENRTLVGMAWGVNSASSKNSAKNKSSIVFTDFGSYMSEKKWKIRLQFQSNAENNLLNQIALNMLTSCVMDQKILKAARIGNFDFKVEQPVLFFDGASANGLCAVGGVIFLNETHYFTVKLNCGSGSNMKAELMALWCVLKVANIFGLVNVKVYGDSRVTIKWAMGDFKLNVLNLRNWAIRTLYEISKQCNISFEHIYREHNARADKLSKLALSGIEGQIIWEEWLDDDMLDCGEFHFLD